MAFGDYLETTPWLCFHSVCPMVIGHSVAYTDHDHLTRTYVEALAPLFDSALPKVLASQRPKTAKSGPLRR